MLRNALLIVGLCLLAIGAGVGLAGEHAFLPFLIWGAIIVAAVQLERWRYRPGDSQARLRAENGWEATGERFVDPETGESMQVLYNASTGERRYRPAGNGEPGGGKA